MIKQRFTLIMITALLIVLISSCKKEEIEPVPQPIEFKTYRMVTNAEITEITYIDNYNYKKNCRKIDVKPEDKGKYFDIDLPINKITTFKLEMKNGENKIRIILRSLKNLNTWAENDLGDQTTNHRLTIKFTATK